MGIMTIRIRDASAIDLVDRPDDLEKQIVRAWHRSDVDHRFESEERFKKAVRKNRKTLRSPDAIEALFHKDNYHFSTKEKGKRRLETLYFENRATRQIGRLRQEHPKGPLAKIDKEPRTHLFLSKVRYKRLKLWHEENPCCIPAFCCRELCLVEGKYHVEFACEEKELRWHASKGTVKVNRKPEPLIRAALKDILGIQ